MSVREVAAAVGQVILAGAALWFGERFLHVRDGDPRDAFIALAVLITLFGTR